MNPFEEVRRSFRFDTQRHLWDRLVGSSDAICALLDKSHIGTSDELVRVDSVEPHFLIYGIKLFESFLAPPGKLMALDRKGNLVAMIDISKGTPA